MKAIRIFFLVYVLCCFNTLLAQEELGNGFLFPQFEKGSVVFKNRSQTAALLNYNMLQQEMLFQDADNTIMALSNPTEVLVVIIGERRFFPVSSKGIFYEAVEAGKDYFYVQHKAIMISQGKGSAYGGYSQTSSITSYGTFHGGSGETYRLNPDEKFKMKIEKYYYLQSGSNYKKFNTAKSLGKLFKGQGAKIEEFAKVHSIDFSNPDDITRIVEYGFSL